ncbi:MAG: CGNR zinc finger domain-containing protein [Sphingomicrobium sp.]
MPEDRDGFRFRGAHVALDLTSTMTRRLKDDPKDLLASPRDLDRWLVSSGLAAESPGSVESDLALARALREAIYVLALGKNSRAAREQLNSIAALRPAVPNLSASGKVVRRGSASEQLATIAGQAVELFGSADASRVRQCEGSGCAILFLDQSRSGRRRWCSMEGCGNRAKAEAFRHRSREI